MPKNARKDIKKGLGKGLGALLQTSEQTFEEINQQQTHELPLKEIEPNPDQLVKILRKMRWKLLWSRLRISA